MDTQNTPINLPKYLPLSDAPKPPASGISSTGLWFSMVIPPLGIIVSLVALVKAKRAYTTSRKAIAGIIIGTILFIVQMTFIIWFIWASATGSSGAAKAMDICSYGKNPPPVMVDGVKYNCNPIEKAR